MKILRWLAVLAVAAAAALAGASWWVSRPLFDDRLDPAILDDIAIAAPDQALTFARANLDGAQRLLLVMRYRGGRVAAIDLTARLGAGESDPLALYRRLGYAALAAEAASIANLVSVDAAALDVPFDAPEHNIGVGLNYREHARESQLDAEPFVFPKLARPTPSRGDIARGNAARLDYEAEVGLVLLEEARGPDAALGLVLANEVTDRWALVRNFRRGAPMGTTGFADGKSGTGFAPLGNLLVIPRDAEAFVRNLELRLYVNGRLRQHESASAMIWGPREAMRQVFARAGLHFAYRGGSVPLLNAGAGLAAGTVVFSGTPAGVIFRPLNVWNPWLYLRPGDEVTVRADYLGVIRNRITE